MILDLDYESRSCVDLTSVGIHNYASHPSTEIILASFSIDEGPIKLWQPHLEPIPEELKWALEDPLVEQKWAFNVAFERIMTWRKLGIKVPFEEWRDVQVMARYYSLPGNLENVGAILKIESQKLKEGKSLIKLFCEPFIDQKDTPLFGLTDPVFKDWNTNPVEWERFCQYNIQDVRAQQEERWKLKDFDLPAHEWKMWFLDQKINNCGWLVNLDLINGAIDVVEKEQTLLLDELRDLTGADNPNSATQILQWAKTQNYPFSVMGKAFVDRAIKGEGGITDLCKRALLIRQQVSKSSVKKLYAIRSNACADGRIREQFVFGGAARTMRWSGRDCQLQNLARPTKEVEKNTDRAIDLLTAVDHATIKSEFSSVIDVATSCIRPTLIAPKGKKLVVADFSSVENRVIGWVSGCKRMLEVFEKGLDPYKDFACDMFNKPYDSITKEERNQSKPATLGCGFGLGAGEEKVNEAGDLVRSGLLGYSYAMGISMTQEEANRAVQIFRKKFPEIPRLWKALDSAAIDAVQEKEPQQIGVLTFDCADDRVLRMILPSGRVLHYADPLVQEEERISRDGESYTKTFVSFMGMDQVTRQWTRMQSRPGLWTENSVQAIARDLLANGLREADKEGMIVIGHIHDEIICEADENDEKALDNLIQCMIKLPKWAAKLPIGAEGFCSPYYKKG